jgi:hypothetical protein
MKLVGERRAIASIIFVFYFFLFLLLAISPELPPGLDKPFYALCGVYGLAFFSLVAGYFWARWYSVGLGLFGLTLAALATWQAGQLVPQFTFLGLTHLAAIGALWGSPMSELYDGQTAWREKFHMDESAVQRLGRSVIRAGMSLPMVLLYGLMPKPGAAQLALSIGAVVLTAVGLRAVVHLRTWGVVAFGAAGAMLLSLSGLELASSCNEMRAVYPALGGSLLLAAAAPWMPAMLRWFHR